jgi:Zn-finger nucleic acid-binding protein
MEHHGYMETRFVRIDRCPRCDVVFTDAGELDAMAELWARSHRRRADNQDHRQEELKRSWWTVGYAPINRK